jgi:hypothetical protein
LLGKQKALSSNPSPTRKKKKEKEKTNQKKSQGAKLLTQENGLFFTHTYL